MRVFGVDPGSLHLGWGLVEAQGNTLTHIASGTLHPPQHELAARLRYLGDALDELLRTHRPDVGAVERVFHAKNSQSALILGQARGVTLLCLARAEAPVFEYTAGQIKQAVTGRGRAEKEQVQTMVRLLLGLREAMELDTSDALAAAICHVHTGSGASAFLARAAGRR